MLNNDKPSGDSFNIYVYGYTEIYFIWNEFKDCFLIYYIIILTFINDIFNLYYLYICIY